MRLHALSVVFGALLFTSAIAHAMDRGQLENVPDDIRARFKGVLGPDGRPCCDIADGHRTIYDVRAGSYWVPIDGVWWRVPGRAVVRNAGNPVGEAVVWYVSVRGNIEIRCFVPADASYAAKLVRIAPSTCPEGTTQRSHPTGGAGIGPSSDGLDGP